MLLLFGTRGFDKVKAEGHFHCPRCAEKRSYTQREVKQWFTLYFVPVIPMGSGGEFVQCDYCGTDFNLNVLQLDPDHDYKMFLQAYAGAVRRIMALAVRADDVDELPPFETSQDIFARATSGELRPGELEAEVQAAGVDGMGLSHFVPPLMRRLDDPAKERLLLVGHESSMRRGSYSAQQRRLVDELSSLLGMTPAHVQGVLSQASYRAPH